jgi:hypothetical protein
VWLSLAGVRPQNCVRPQNRVQTQHQEQPDNHRNPSLPCAGKVLLRVFQNFLLGRYYDQSIFVFVLLPFRFLPLFLLFLETQFFQPLFAYVEPNATQVIATGQSSGNERTDILAGFEDNPCKLRRDDEYHVHNRRSPSTKFVLA